MEVTYESSDFRGNPTQESKLIGDFIYNEVLFHDDYHGDTKKVILEEQAKAVCFAMGRMVEILIKKNVLGLEDLKHITGCDWGRKADSLAIKKEEE
jgi:hypothetical protein